MIKIKKQGIGKVISRKRKHLMGAKRPTNMNGKHMENGYIAIISRILMRKSVKQ